MWIRSQSKTRLIKTDYIIVNETDILATPNSDSFLITIGEYSSQEKALKVLDMIQNQINMNEEFASRGENHNNNGSLRLIKFVYQMPLDSEVEENE